MRAFKRTAQTDSMGSSSTAAAFAATAPMASRAADSSPPAASRNTMATARPETSAAPRGSASTPDNYFKFTDKHERYLVRLARRHTSALVIDALYDTAKWQFLTEIKPTSSLGDGVATKAASDDAGLAKHVTPAQRGLEVFELRPQAMDRVACVAPRLASDPEQLAMRAHTLLARTRVRGKLDEFMKWMTSKRRAVYQGMMNTLHEGHLQHCDVFSGFEAENPQVSSRQELEQFALKYFVVEPTSAAMTLDSTRHTTSAAPTNAAIGTSQSVVGATKRTLNFLRRKGSSDLNDPVQQQQQQTKVRQQLAQASKTPEERMHFCVGEYSTVRQGVMRPDRTGDLRAPSDNRIGLISYHSVEDPDLLQLCNSVAKKTTPRDVSKCTSRTLLQYSGIIAYPVASEEDDGADYLEVIIKISCFDARGLSSQKRATMFSFIAGFRNLAHTMLVMRLRASPFLTATHWVADERRKCCLVCQQRFSTLRRRHHCRLCGEVTCSKCSAVHQVRLVKEAKASLRICLLCVQGVDRPKWKELAVDEELAEQEQQTRGREASTQSQPQAEEAEDPLSADEITTRETEPKHLLTFSLVTDLQKPQSPTSTVTDSSSPVDQLMHSHGPSVSGSSEASSVDSDSHMMNFTSTIRDFHDSAFNLPMKAPTNRANMSVLTDTMTELHESMMSFDDDDEEEDESDMEDGVKQLELEPVSEVPAPKAQPVQPIRLYDEPEKSSPVEINRTVRRISNLDDGEDKEDEDDARLHALAAFGLLEADSLVDGVIPEDIALQTIVKEAAQYMDCAIAAIGFVDASRDMVSAAYSASPLCQVPRGVLPKQYSLTWEVMKRCSTEKHIVDDVSHVTILDTSKDKTLKKNPFVLDTPFVRFMVGVPIRAWTGVVVGAIMIADIQPRTEVTPDQILALKSHAALVETWLENRREEVATQRLSARGVNHAEKLHDRLAEMLNTSYQTTLELQMRGLQMQQQAPMQQRRSPTTPPTSTTKAAPPIRHVLY